jgi:hypothetical protein
MQTTIMRTEKSSRWAAILLAAVVAIITSIVVANATQTITTPNAAFISFNLAGGANSATITPATNKSVLIMGCTTRISFPAVGQVSLIHIPSNIMAWVGVESFNGSTAKVIQGLSATAGTHIVYIDFSNLVDIQVASADTIRVHNGDVNTLAGNVTLIW